MTPRAAVDGGKTPGPARSEGNSHPQPACPFNARARQGPRVPSLKPPRQPLFLLLLPVSAVPLMWDTPHLVRPLPTPATACSRDSAVTLLFHAASPTPSSPAPLGCPPVRAPAPAPAPFRRRAERRRGGAEARRGTADVGLALSRSLPGWRGGHAHSRGRARTAGRRQWLTRRRWLHFPGLRGVHNSSRGQEPWEPELERLGAAAAAPRVSPGRHTSTAGTGVAGRSDAWCVVRLSVARRSAGTPSTWGLPCPLPSTPASAALSPSAWAGAP